MRHIRTAWLRGAAIALSVAVSSSVFAQQLELKIMAPASPGGGWDGTARSMQQALTTAGLTKSVQVTNVTGAGGTIGLAQLITAGKGDGSQLMVSGFVMLGAILTNKAPVSLDQTTPIARLTAEALVFVVPAESPLKSAKDLIAAIKADPARTTWAGGSAGGVDHIAAALTTQAAGVDATKINYIPFSGGGEALAAMLGGRVTVGVSGYGEFEGQIKAGKLRALAVTSETRLEGIDVPTLKEQGIDLAVMNWRSVFAPPGLTPDQVKTLSDLIHKMVTSKEWAEILKARGWDNAYLSGDAFATFLQDETKRVGAVLKSVGLVK